jgi:pimeloyl-ACP methyl ester carboxylesterase
MLERTAFSVEGDPSNGGVSRNKLLTHAKSIYFHYAASQFFLPKNYLSKHVDALQNLDILMVHGRQDLICPIDGVADFAKQLAKTRLIILPCNGHSFTEKGKAMLKRAYANFFATL